MSSLERMLIENMMRFGPKNLTEWDQRKLKQLLKEQNPAAGQPSTPVPTTNRQGTVNISGTTAARIVQPSEWGIDGFTAPIVTTHSTKTSASGSLFFDAYRSYMDIANGMIGKTLLVFAVPPADSGDAGKGIEGIYLDPANIVKRITIQSTYVPGIRAKDVTADKGNRYQDTSIKIWDAKQATRNFDLAAKTVIMKSENSRFNQNDAADASIELIWGGNISDQYIEDPKNGYVITSLGNYSLRPDFSVIRSGAIIGYAPINWDTDAVHKTEGYGTILAKGYPEAAEW